MDDGHSTLIDRLPHGAPFRFLTSVLEYRAHHSALASWSLDGSEAFFAWHFPGRPIIPGVLLGEALAQLSGLVGFDAQATNVRLAHIELKLTRPVSPPAEILLRTTFLRNLGRLRHFEVAAEHDGSPVAVGRLVLAGDDAGETHP